MLANNPANQLYQFHKTEMFYMLWTSSWANYTSTENKWAFHQVLVKKDFLFFIFLNLYQEDATVICS